MVSRKYKMDCDAVYRKKRYIKKKKKVNIAKLRRTSTLNNYTIYIYLQVWGVIWM